MNGKIHADEKGSNVSCWLGLAVPAMPEARPLIPSASDLLAGMPGFHLIPSGNHRVFRSLEQAERIISQQLARKRKPT